MKKGKNEIGLTILMPFSISPPMSVSPVAKHWLCSCFIVQAIPAAGSIWAVREQIARNSGVISFFLFDKSSCSRAHVGVEARKLSHGLAAVFLQHCKLPQTALLTPKLPEGWKDSSTSMPWDTALLAQVASSWHWKSCHKIIAWNFHRKNAYWWPSVLISACGETPANYKTALAANTLGKEMGFQHSAIMRALVSQICSIPA